MRLLIFGFFIVGVLYHELAAQVHGNGPGIQHKSPKASSGNVHPRNTLPSTSGQTLLGRAANNRPSGQNTGQATSRGIGPIVPQQPLVLRSQPSASASSDLKGRQLPISSTHPNVPFTSQQKENQDSGHNSRQALTPHASGQVSNTNIRQNSNAGNTRSIGSSSVSQINSITQDGEFSTYQFALQTSNTKAPKVSNDQEVTIARKVLGDTECSIMINEVFLGNTGFRQFIELKKVCGRHARSSSQSLNGYILVGIDWTENPKIVLTVNLKEQKLVRKVEENRGENNYFVVGAPQTNVDMVLGNLKSPKQVQYLSYPRLTEMLPDDVIGMVSLFLLYFPTDSRNDIKLFDLPSKKDALLVSHFEPLPLSTQHKNIIQCRIIDGMFYGLESRAYPTFISTNLGLRAPPLFRSYETGSDISYSRCGSQFLDQDTFKYLVITPGVDNNCPLEHKVPFPSFRGVPLPVVAQKIAINVHHSLSSPERNLILKGPPIEVAARILGVSMHKLIDILRDFKNNNLHKAAKRQPNRPKPVQSSIDSMDREVIKSFVANCYKSGRAPYFRDIYYNFINYKKKGCITYTTSSSELSITRFLPLCTPAPIVSQILQLSNVPSTTCQGGSQTVTRTSHTANDDPEYSCGANTFKKVLKAMGYRYGRINDRVMLLQRPDIIAWRTRYLRKLQENAKKETPLKLLFTDETWLEQNRRSDKGWRIHRPATYKESTMNAFPTNKIGHGHRSVVIAAGTEDGIIKESILVYEVKKQNVEIDYHGNVDSQTYMKWFKNLILVLNASGHKYMIIMDNASYHASSKAPKSGTRKADLYKWVREISGKPNLHITVPDISQITVAELWLIVRKLKERDDMKEYIFEVDKYARENGHEVVRLPPYNCHLNPIEFLWSVVKRRVAERNIHQDIKEVIKIARETLENMDPQIFRNQINHCMKLGDKHRVEDGYIENESVPVPMVIDVGNDSDDSDAESICSSEYESDEVDLQPLDVDPEELEAMLGHQEHSTWAAAQSPPPVTQSKRPRWCFRDLKHGLDPYTQNQ